MFSSFRRHCGLSVFVLLGACAATSAPSPAPVLPAASMELANASAAGATPEARIEADVRYLADDARRGREAGTQEYRDAATYVAARMAGLGLDPAGENGWFQEVTLRSLTPVLDASAFSITDAQGKTTELKHLDQFLVFPGEAAETLDITAPVVFVGYGVHAPEQGHDDYAGLDVDGKIVAYFSGGPDSLDGEVGSYYASNATKARMADAQGAIGIITLYSLAGEKRYPWERLISNPTSRRMTWVHPDGRAFVNGPGIQGAGVVRPEMTQMLFEGAPKTYAQVREEVDQEGVAPTGFPLKVTVTMKGRLEATEVKSPNVAGIIRGSDPVLKNEYVVLSGHLDHLGVNQRLVDEGKDGINNGVLDNAVGVSTMLEAARSLMEGERPSRSILVLAVTAEEKGLLGSDYFAHYPTVPIDSIVANVNLDMPIALYPFTDVVAFGAEHSTMGDFVRDAAAKMDIKLSPDPLPEQGLFTRSDHYRFVQQGVPSVFLVTGFANGGEEKFNYFLTNNYHKPSDDLNQPIQFDAAAKFADVNTLIALELANADERPRWNEGNFFGELYGRD